MKKKIFGMNILNRKSSLQLLIYDDNANYAHICHINGWLDYYE